MSEIAPEANNELIRLEERAKKLAMEKAHLNLLIHMMSQLSTVTGLENAVENLLKVILNNIGGVNLVLYYWIDEEIYYADVFGKKAKLNTIEDAYVAQVAKSHIFFEYEHDFSDTQMITQAFTKAQTWVIPLLVGPDLIAVLKVEGLHIGTEALKQQLPTFFNYVALLLKNEILGYTQLQKAYSQLSESTERFMAIFEQAPLGIALIDSLTRHIYEVNQKFAEIVGRTRPEMAQIDWISITHPDDVQEDLDNMALLNAGKITGFDMNKRYIRPDGSLVWINMAVAPIQRGDQTHPHHLCMIEDITDRKRMEAEILTLSITDQLTGLHNRRGFLSLAGQQLKLSDRNKRGVQLYFADLDGLKWINDTLGHEEGDKALIEAANIFKETFRTSDIIARLGGDEYAALAIDITEENSEIFTARLQSLIDTQNNQENRRYRLSISVGCSYYDPENPCSLDELMAHADQLMYERKQNKKGPLL